MRIISLISIVSLFFAISCGSKSVNRRSGLPPTPLTTSPAQEPNLNLKKIPFTFSIMSYNIENLFDQKDDDRNSSYGDYRINANDKGQYSNYHETVDFEGEKLNFTQIKIAGIRKVLTAFSETGPDIVALQEVESADVVAELFEAVKDLGYAAAEFSGWDDEPVAVNTAILSKFPIEKSSLISIPKVNTSQDDQNEPLRPLHQITLNINDHSLTVFNNHWKSKSGPESKRVAAAVALEQAIEQKVVQNPLFDYVVVGDFNSSYNENKVLEDTLNDTQGKTGINDILKAQGDEVAVVNKDSASTIKYDLWYEQSKDQRKSVYSGPQYGWSTFDHIIIGSSLYDQLGISYVDHSFFVPTMNNAAFRFLFTEDGTTLRWQLKREGKTFTRHVPGGYSDHVPIFAKFFISPEQTPRAIVLENPGTPD